MAEAAVLARRRRMADPEDLGFLVGLARKAAREHVVADLAIHSEIQRHHIELHACAALDEQYLIVIAEPHELLDVGLGLIVHCVISLGAVADLRDGHARVVEIQQFCLGFLEYLQRQHGRAWIEIIDAICLQNENLPKCNVSVIFCHRSSDRGRFVIRIYSNAKNPVPSSKK